MGDVEIANQQSAGKVFAAGEVALAFLVERTYAGKPPLERPFIAWVDGVRAKGADYQQRMPECGCATIYRVKPSTIIELRKYHKKVRRYDENAYVCGCIGRIIE